MSLYILSHQHLSADIYRMLETLDKGDALVLIEDATYLACQRMQTRAPVFALAADLQARGITEKINAQFTSIDFDSFVDLSESHSSIISWQQND